MNQTSAIDLIEVVLSIIAVIVVPLTAGVVKTILDIAQLKRDSASAHEADAEIKKQMDEMHHVLIEEINSVRSQQGSVFERLVKIETLLELLVKGFKIEKN